MSAVAVSQHLNHRTIVIECIGIGLQLLNSRALALRLPLLFLISPHVATKW